MMLASNDGFIPAPSPFADICFISCSNVGIVERIINTCPQLGLSWQNAGSFLYAGNCRLKEHMFSGYGKMGSNIFWGNEDIKPERQDALYGVGNYTYFSFRENSVFCCHDYFGLGSIYVYSDNEIRLVTNRPHLAAIFASFSPDRRINEMVVKAQMLGATTWFRRNSGLDKTPIENLERLPTRKYLVFQDSGFEFSRRERPHTDMTYEEILERATKEIYDNVNFLQKKLADKTFVWDLSGGKDTRMTIAPFMDRVLYVNTSKDDRMIPDMKISNQIVSIFPNIKYNDRYYGDPQYMDQETALDAWRSLSFGQSHLLFLSDTATAGNSKKIAVSGGAGEIYRTSFIYSKPKAKCTIKEWLTYILDKEVYLNRLSDTDKNDVRNFMLSELLPSLENVEEENDAMSQLYYSSPMRGHFGNRLFFVYCESMVIYPALNLDLYLASRRFTIEQRNEGILVYDFVKRINELLASIDYAKYDKYQNSQRRFVAEPMPERLEAAEKSYYAAFKKISAERNELLKSQSKPKTQSENAFLNIKACEAASRIIIMHPELENIMMSLYALFNSIQNPGGKKAVASKIFSIDDYICPLKSEKYKFKSINKMNAIINPVEGFKIENNKLYIKTFDYIKSQNFFFAIYLRNNGKTIKNYPYKSGKEFEILNNDYDTVQIFAKNRTSNIKSVLTYKLK